MALQKPDTREALASMRAIKAVVTADSPMLDVQIRAMEMAQRYFLGTHAEVAALEPISPEELAGEVKSADLRRQLVQVMCGYVMLGKEIRPAHLAAIKRYARALDIDEPAVDHLRYAMEDRIRWLKFDFRRRNAVGEAIKKAYHDDGIAAAVGIAMQIAGMGQDEALAARFDALASLPEGTFGRALFDFYREHGFTLPGYPHGTPLPLVTHDMAHILAGYGTDIMGEIRVLSFQTGFKREKPLTYIFLLLFQLQLGVEMVALAPGVGSLKGYFDDPSVLEAVFKAYSRGAAMNIDLMSGDWDYWAVMDRPVAELRERYGVPPQ